MNVFTNKEGIPIVATPEYWRKRTVDRLKMAFDNLKEARDFLLHSKQLMIEYEPLFQQAGRAMLDIAKNLNKTTKQHQQSQEDKDKIKQIMKEEKKD